MAAFLMDFEFVSWSGSAFVIAGVVAAACSAGAGAACRFGSCVLTLASVLTFFGAAFVLAWVALVFLSKWLARASQVKKCTKSS